MSSAYGTTPSFPHVPEAGYAGQSFPHAGQPHPHPPPHSAPHIPMHFPQGAPAYQPSRPAGHAGFYPPLEHVPGYYPHVYPAPYAHPYPHVVVREYVPQPCPAAAAGHPASSCPAHNSSCGVFEDAAEWSSAYAPRTASGVRSRTHGCRDSGFFVAVRHGEPGSRPTVYDLDDPTQLRELIVQIEARTRHLGEGKGDASASRAGAQPETAGIHAPAGLKDGRAELASVQHQPTGTLSAAPETKAPALTDAPLAKSADAAQTSKPRSVRVEDQPSKNDRSTRTDGAVPKSAPALGPQLGERGRTSSSGTGVSFGRESSIDEDKPSAPLNDEPRDSSRGRRMERRMPRKRDQTPFNPSFFRNFSVDEDADDDSSSPGSSGQREGARFSGTKTAPADDTMGLSEDDEPCTQGSSRNVSVRDCPKRGITLATESSSEPAAASASGAQTALNGESAEVECSSPGRVRFSADQVLEYEVDVLTPRKRLPGLGLRFQTSLSQDEEFGSAPSPTASSPARGTGPDAEPAQGDEDSGNRGRSSTRRRPSKRDQTPFNPRGGFKSTDESELYALNEEEEDEPVSPPAAKESGAPEVSDQQESEGRGRSSSRRRPSKRDQTPFNRAIFTTTFSDDTDDEDTRRNSSKEDSKGERNVSNDCDSENAKPVRRSSKLSFQIAADEESPRGSRGRDSVRRRPSKRDQTPFNPRSAASILAEEEDEDSEEVSPKQAKGHIAFGLVNSAPNPAEGQEKSARFEVDVAESPRAAKTERGRSTTQRKPKKRDQTPFHPRSLASLDLNDDDENDDCGKGALSPNGSSNVASKANVTVGNAGNADGRSTGSRGNSGSNRKPPLFVGESEDSSPRRSSSAITSSDDASPSSRNSNREKSEPGSPAGRGRYSERSANGREKNGSVSNGSDVASGPKPREVTRVLSKESSNGGVEERPRGREECRSPQLRKVLSNSKRASTREQTPFYMSRSLSNPSDMEEEYTEIRRRARRPEPTLPNIAEDDSDRDPGLKTIVREGGPSPRTSSISDGDASSPSAHTDAVENHAAFSADSLPKIVETEAADAAKSSAQQGPTDAVNATEATDLQKNTTFLLASPNDSEADAGPEKMPGRQFADDNPVF